MTSHQGGPLLTAEEVSVSFGDRLVLRDVSFQLNPGEFTGLIGTNGSGKTTLLRVLLGLQRPDAGRITWGHASKVRPTIGYVPQKVQLDPDAPVRARDLVRLGIDGNRYGLPRRSRVRDAAVDAMLETVGATSFANQKVGSLSGGEQQRILIAHAMMSAPQLVLLDEPLANLDPGSVGDVVALLARVSRENGVSVVISAHEINALLPAMDRVIYIANHSVRSGPVEEVVRSDVLTELYGHHVDVVRLHGRLLVVTSDGLGANVVTKEHDDVVIA